MLRWIPVLTLLACGDAQKETKAEKPSVEQIKAATKVPEPKAANKGDGHKRRAGLVASARPQSASASRYRPSACAAAARLQKHVAANAPASAPKSK